MKLFQVVVTERLKKGNPNKPKVRPVVLIAKDGTSAKDQLELYWGKENYKWGRPNMIADFNPD